jgi:hypothetical protein
VKREKKKENQAQKQVHPYPSPHDVTPSSRTNLFFFIYLTFLFLGAEPGAGGAGKLITIEEKREGSVEWNVYKRYVVAGGLSLFLLVMVGYIFETGIKSTSDWYNFALTKNQNKTKTEQNKTKQREKKRKKKSYTTKFFKI